MVGNQAAGGVPLFVLGALAAVMTALAIGAATARDASAAAFPVSNTNNSGPGSLRAAIAAAEANPGPDVINIGPSVRGDIEVYNIAGQEGFSIYADVTINGSGFVAVDGNDQTRVFGIASGAKATIRGITIKNGKTYGPDPNGGGITSNGNLTLDRVVVSGNDTDPVGLGGGVYNLRGTLTVTNSTFVGNRATNGNGGGINNFGTMTVTNVTVGGNTATGNSGGIYFAGTDLLRNTIVAGNTAPTSPDMLGSFDSQGNNLVGDPSGASGFVASDLLDRNPLLGPLQNNGGPTPTRALLPGSPAVDRGSNAGCPTVDQRGALRRDGDGNGSVVCDIGAYERTDLASPRVASTSPAAGATNVGRGANLSATFSEKMTRSTLNTATFRLFRVNADGSATQVAGATTVVASADGLKAALNPFGAAPTLLSANTTYRAVVTTEARDLAGNQLDQNPGVAGAQQMVWTFRTGLT